MNYAKPICIITIILLKIYTTFGMDAEPTLEEQIAQEIAAQNVAIDKQNDLLTQQYQEQVIQCTTTASGSHTEILSQLESCAKMEKPKLKQLVITWTASGAIVPLPPTTWRWLEKMDDYNIVISDWMNSQEIEYVTHIQWIVCRKQPTSPLCTENFLLEKLYLITEKRIPWKNWFPILVWITNAESSLWLDFAKDSIGGTCHGRNNWWGTKYQIHDDNTRDYSRSLKWFLYWQKYSWRFVDQYGCNLYPFKSVEEFWITKVNGMRFWYKWCIDSPTPIKCLSYQYVWDPKVSEQSWINNVSLFLE